MNDSECDDLSREWQGADGIGELWQEGKEKQERFRVERAYSQPS
jgi:hypothetical protein